MVIGSCICFIFHIQEFSILVGMMGFICDMVERNMQTWIKIDYMSRPGYN